MSLILEWNNEQNAYEIGGALIAKLEELLRIAGEQEGIAEGEVALTFVDDEEIHRLNREYRGIDRPTDVLSFAMQEMGDEELAIQYDDEDAYEAEELEGFEDDDAAEGDGHGGPENPGIFVEPLGDIIISVPRAIAQSEEYGHSIERELGFLFVHGFLHLIGYDHGTEEEEKEMFAKQEHILQKAGLTR
jgi:probable rRNA maturation factor